MNNELLNRLRRIKHSCSRMTKRAVECMFANTITIDVASDPLRVRRLIERLRSHESNKPLVRIGGKEDGGYLLPDDFEGIKHCISPGVSQQISFDLEMAARGINVVMADASVDGPPIKHERFTFHKKFLGVENNEMFIRLEDLCATVPTEGDMILQMDIEGAEYSVLLDTPEEILRRFRIIVLEVHDLTHVFGAWALPIIEALVAKIYRSHVVVHIHPNNCCGSVSRNGIEIPRVMEFTFYRRDRGVSETPLSRAYPHILDVDNCPKNPPLRLAGIWT